MGIATADNRVLTGLQNPALKYLGFMFLISYHYAMWFLPAEFAGLELLDNSVTNSWLQNLLAMVVTLIVVAVILGKRGHLVSRKVMLIVCPAVLFLGTAMMRLCAFLYSITWFMLFVSSLLGIAEAILWVLWAEYYAKSRAKFTMYHFGLTFGVVLFVVLVSAYFLPETVLPWALAVLPVLSSALLVYLDSCENRVAPVLLPREIAATATKPITALCIMGFIASASCYFLACIIPWEQLPSAVNSFMLGVIVAAFLVVVLALASSAAPMHADIYKLFPYVFILIIVGFGLYLGAESLWFAAFLIALGVSCIFEVLIISYFGTLSTGRYISPALAFSLAAIATRGGIILGNSVALIYEANVGSAWVEAAIIATCIVFLVLVSIALVTVTRGEYRLLALLNTPQTKDDIERICEAMGVEFGLSERELEILKQLAKGRSAQAIADHFVISAHTVNTHIRHIYDKTGIHKRQELLDYINRG